IPAACRRPGCARCCASRRVRKAARGDLHRPGRNSPDRLTLPRETASFLESGQRSGQGSSAGKSTALIMPGSRVRVPPLLLQRVSQPQLLTAPAATGRRAPFLRWWQRAIGRTPLSTGWRVESPPAEALLVSGPGFGGGLTEAAQHPA